MIVSFNLRSTFIILKVEKKQKESAVKLHSKSVPVSPLSHSSTHPFFCHPFKDKPASLHPRILSSFYTFSKLGRLKMAFSLQTYSWGVTKDTHMFLYCFWDYDPGLHQASYMQKLPFSVIQGINVQPKYMGILHYLKLCLPT